MRRLAAVALLIALALPLTGQATAKKRAAVTTVSVPVSLAPGGQVAPSARCPKGTHVTGGGWSVSAVSGGSDHGVAQGARRGELGGSTRRWRRGTAKDSVAGCGVIPARLGTYRRAGRENGWHGTSLTRYRIAFDPKGHAWGRQLVRAVVGRRSTGHTKAGSEEGGR